MNKDLVMVFINDIAKKVTIRVKDVKEDVTAAQVKTLMDVIITHNIFNLNGGSLKTKESAKLVQSTQEILDVVTL